MRSINKDPHALLAEDRTGTSYADPAEGRLI